MNTNILVSVCLITYNHEEYVRQALESILMQQTGFNCEILIADDCSTDNTQQILKEYKKKYPDKIKLYLRDENLGATKNSYLLKKECKGKYLAPLEGDDYWLDINRLQYLIDFLENNPKYVGIGHKRERYDTEDNFLGYDPHYEVLNKPFSVHDFLKGKRYSFSGSVYKNYFLNTGDKYKEISLISRNVGDFTQSMILLDMGDVFITDKCFSVYRVRRSEGESNYNSLFSHNEKYDDHMRIIEAVETYFNGKYNLTRERARRKYGILRYYANQKEFNEIKKLIKSINLKEFFCFFIIIFNIARNKLLPGKKKK